MNCRVPDSFEYPNAYVSLNIVKSTWGEFREALATRTFHINETDKALQCTFLKVLDDYLNELGDSCEKELMDILPTHKLGRGTKLNAGEKVTPDVLCRIQYISQEEIVLARQESNGCIYHTQKIWTRLVHVQSKNAEQRQETVLDFANFKLTQL